MLRRPARPAPYHAAVVCLLLAASVAGGQVTGTDRADLADRPISEIRIEGLRRVDEQLVRNQLRAAVGDPFDPATVSEDVRRLERLGQFRHVEALAEMTDDGAVALIYRLTEAPIIAEVQVVGNKVISDQELLGATRITRGAPRDDFLIERAKRAIEEAYRERGYFLTSVFVDESELEESGILFFRVIEGPRVKVKAIEFEGNTAFSDRQLHAEIETRTAFPLFRRGELDEEQLAADVAAITRFYKERGYLDVQADRRLEISPDQTEAKVTFLIVEGPRYTLGSIRTDPDPPAVFSREQLEALVEIKPGDVYSRDRIRASLEAVRDAYGMMGYVDAEVRDIELHSSERPEVTLLLRIDEGRRYKVGLITITGNFLTLDRVIRRHLRELRPGRPFDTRQIERARQRIRETRLFNNVNVTIQDPDPRRPGYRDVLVEVSEANTGSINFGVAAGSDTGVFGEFSLIQRNFDITDVPESFGEFFSGRAFRGGGQRFSMTLRPGDELFQYIVGWSEPALFDSEYSLSASGQFSRRQFRSQGRTLYDEQRISFPVTIGRRLGEVWHFGLTGRFDDVELDDISPEAPVDVFEAAGPDQLTSLTLAVTRSTVTTLRRPGRGTRLEASVEQTGVFGGDFSFTKVAADYTVFLTVGRDFLGRRSILKLNARAGYIFGDEAPTYERFYLGGRSLRGFEFRTVSPKGIRADTGLPGEDPVGGDWLMFLGAQYEVPLIGETLNGVIFVDSGTVTDDIGLDDYRVSVGAGLRIAIDQFGPVPIALDFAFPIASEDDDETEVFSFSAELPF